MTRFTSARATRWIADIDKQIALTQKALADQREIYNSAKGGRLQRVTTLLNITKGKLEVLREERKAAEAMLVEFK